MTAKKSNTRPVATNYPLIFIILIITTAASLGLYFIALKKTGISGISWLSSACLWALLNSFITYRDSVFRQDNFFKTTFFTILESVQLLFLTSALLFFFNYNILIGLPILFIYSLFKMLKSTHPFFQLTEKVIYSNRDAIRQLGKKGAWVTDEIIEIAGEIKLREISSQVPVPAAIEPVRTPLPPGPPKKLKINIPIPPEMDNEAPQDKNLQETNETTSTKKVEDIYMKSIDQQKKEIIRDEWILEKLRDIFGFKEEEEITENYQEISKRLSDLLFNSEYVDYQIPEELSASGLDDIPKSEGKSDLIQMDIRKRIQILLFLALNDMSRIFRMKIIDPVEVRIVFPWENTEEEKKEKKLTEKLKTELGWIISITGALREDFTYALLAANLVDIWFDENAQEEVSSYKKGFHFWVAYKLLKYRKYYTAAHNAKRQHYQKFKEIRNIERLYGEHGVFYFILKNDYPGPSPEELEIERIQKTKDIEPPSARREFLTIEKHFEAKIAAVTLSSLQEEDAKTEILDRARISRLMEDKTSVELGKELREMNKEEQEAEAEDVKKEEIDETATVIEVSEEEA
ncbi:MAG: hypothetical protein K8T10_18845, partial [Candidatus Eremiobacteraeota bacterium]|nr:hypothetical protein [Candidatus Eremiobacteraeota bacterium]